MHNVKVLKTIDTLTHRVFHRLTPIKDEAPNNIYQYT